MPAGAVPDPRTLLADGLRYEKAGLTAEALAAYRAAREATTVPAQGAEALRRMAHAHRARAEWEDALTCARGAQAVAQQAGLVTEYAESLNAEAAVYQARGEHEAARALYERILALSVPERVQGIALQNLGTLAARRGETGIAEQFLAAALERFERARYAWGRAHVLNNRTALELDRRDYAAAERAAWSAIDAAVEVEDLDLLGVAKLNLAEALGGLGRFDEAEDAVSAALGQFEIAKNAWRRVECLRLLGDLMLRRGDPEGARRFFAVALELAERIGSTYESEQLRGRLAALPTPI